MSSAPAAGSRMLFSHQPFLLYFWARGLSEFSYQVAAVAVGWQVYALTHSASISASWGWCNLSLRWF
jgi:hypothetical protein